MENYIEATNPLSPTQWVEDAEFYPTLWASPADPTLDGFLLDCGGCPAEGKSLEASNLHPGNFGIPGNQTFEFDDLRSEGDYRQIAVKDLSSMPKHGLEVPDLAFSIEIGTVSGPIGAEFNCSCTASTCHHALINPGSSRADACVTGEFPQSTEVPFLEPAVADDFWPAPFTLVGSGCAEDFGLHERLVEGDKNGLGTASREGGEIGESKSFSGIFMVEGNSEAQGIQLPDISHGSFMEPVENLCFEALHQGLGPGRPATLQPLPSAERFPAENYKNNQSLVTHSQPAATNLAVRPSDSMKTRVRARRGQATDPHSIAERLRREKIAERMKNLQELIPNASKTDKASMLDEIIDYVKFLQLQVKVLSTSRLGAAQNAAASSVADISSEESRGGSQVVEQGEGGYLREEAESPGTAEAEKHVLSLLESNMAMAMQYLQTKGLCLMPVALAAATAAWKGSSAAAAAQLERRKTRPAAACSCGAKDRDAEPTSLPTGRIEEKPHS
ncbi:uncharacterized protein LOC144704342 [Wolffia australiana]